MNINATLIAQTVHFFIAYALLSRFFLRPLVAIIMQENAYREQLQEEHEAKVALCVQKKELQRQQWIALQEKWQKHIPLLALYVQRQEPHELSLEQPSESQLHDQVRAMTSYIKQRVDDAL